MKRAMLVFALLLAGLTGMAQGQWFTPSAPSSVTSVAPGRPFLPPPSVIATGPQGWRPSHFPGNRFIGGHNRFNRGGFNHHHRGYGYGGVAYSPYVVPYYPMYVEPDYGYYDPNVAPSTSSMYEPDPNYAGQYGLVDPRKRQPVNPPVSSGVREEKNNPESSNNPAPSTTTTASAAPAPAAPRPQPTTILVFKDGHRLEVTNYVIQGATLFNLGDNGPRKIAVNDLNVDDTMKVNDDRGVEFSLP